MAEGFIKSRDGNFFLNGNIFKFIGCNMYELANVDRSTASLMIKDAYEEGFKVIRFWAFEPMKKENLLDICDFVKDYDMKIIPVLADPSGYLQSYKVDYNWYKEDYKKNYIPYLSDIADSFKDRDEILLWELINEPMTNSFEDIYNFAKYTSEKIKTIDSNHLISIGTIGGIGDKFGGFFSRFNSDNFYKLYSLDTLDAVSIHDYSFNSTLLERLDILYRLKGSYKKSNMLNKLSSLINLIPDKIDSYTINKLNKTYDFPFTVRSLWKKFNSKNISTAKKLNKPIYIGEIGFKKNLGGKRKIILETEIKKYFNEGISGILLWSFESQGKSRDGHDYGFDKNDGFKEVNESVVLLI